MIQGVSKVTDQTSRGDEAVHPQFSERKGEAKPDDQLEAVFSLNELGVQYGGKTAVEDVSFDL